MLEEEYRDLHDLNAEAAVALLGVHALFYKALRGNRPFVWERLFMSLSALWLTSKAGFFGHKKILDVGLSRALLNTQESIRLLRSRCYPHVISFLERELNIEGYAYHVHSLDLCPTASTKKFGCISENLCVLAELFRDDSIFLTSKYLVAGKSSHSIWYRMAREPRSYLMGWVQMQKIHIQLNRKSNGFYRLLELAEIIDGNDDFSEEEHDNFCFQATAPFFLQFDGIDVVLEKRYWKSFDLDVKTDLSMWAKRVQNLRYLHIRALEWSLKLENVDRRLSALEAARLD